MEKTDSAPFNSAVATLMRLDRIMIKIQDTTSVTEQAHRQYLKYRLAKEYFVQASPLIPEDDKEKLFNLYKELKLSKNNGNVIFNHETEEQIDLLLIKIQNSLQSAGFFMPKGKERRL